MKHRVIAKRKSVCLGKPAAGRANADGGLTFPGDLRNIY